MVLPQNIRISVNRKLLGLLAFTTIFFITYTSYSDSPSLLQVPYFKSKSSCSPADYSNGEWVYLPHTSKSNMTESEDALQFSGFNGCASSREFLWHLAADRKEQWDRFPRAQSWKWVPGKSCSGLRPLDAQQFVKDLVEDGGWYLVGDSVTENLFFSLSCILHGHVIATPNYVNGQSFDRAWPQNLYLNPESPLLESINFPSNFDVVKTPLVTFRRIDVLFSQEELIQIHREIQPEGTILQDDSLFGEQAVWTIPLPEYLAEFSAPLPDGNYKTMVVSTAGHWTTETFSKVSPPGIDGVLNLFKHAMKRWADTLEDHIRLSDTTSSSSRFGLGTKRASRKRVVVRAYLPGHEDCHAFRDPWKVVQPFQHFWWNWGEISKFNDIFDKLLLNRKIYPDIHYLGIDRPARLRPDAHVTGDCLHIMVGAGVLEGWSHYIWHYITKQL